MNASVEQAICSTDAFFVYTKHIPLSNRLSKYEHIKSRSLINILFQKGHSKVFYPLRLVWIKTPLPIEQAAQIAVTVGKRHFPKAVDRNRIKRQMREAYRLYKNTFYRNLTTQLPEEQVALMFIFVGKKKEKYDIVEKNVQKALNHLLRTASVIPKEQK